MGIRLVFIIALALSVENIFAQDKIKWQNVEVDENLTALLPKDFEKIDTVLHKNNVAMRFKVFKCKTAYAVFGITVTTEGTDIKADNSEDLEEAYKGIEEGFKKNAASRGLSCNFKDTVVDKIPGRKVVVYSNESASSFSTVAYLFLLNDKIYEIVSSPIDGSTMETGDRNKLIAGLHFTATEISEKKFSSKAESRGYKIGELFGEIIGFLFIIGLVVGFIILITKRK